MIFLDANKQLGEPAVTSDQKINNTQTKPLIVDLNPQQSKTTTLPKVVNKEPSQPPVSDSASNTLSKVTNTQRQMSADVLQREFYPLAHIEHSSSQPQLSTLEKSYPPNTMSNSHKQSQEESNESQHSSDEGSQLAAGDAKDMSLNGNVKSQNDVNKVREGGSQSNLNESESDRWRNISQSDESSIHNHYNMEIGRLWFMNNWIAVSLHIQSIVCINLSTFTSDQRRSRDSQLLEENFGEESMESIGAMLDRHVRVMFQLCYMTFS